jgi:hypothetical protein
MPETPIAFRIPRQCVFCERPGTVRLQQTPERGDDDPGVVLLGV